MKSLFLSIYLLNIYFLFIDYIGIYSLFTDIVTIYSSNIIIFTKILIKGKAF